MIDHAVDDRERHVRAAEVVDRVLRRYMADGSLDAADADDIRSVVLLRLVQRMAYDAPDDIRSFDEFVAVMAHNAARDLFRGRRPDRWQLRKRVQATLRGDDRFVVVRDGATWCALRDQAAAAHAEPPALTAADVAAARTLPLRDVVALLLRRAGGPIRFEQLTDLVAEAIGTPLGAETAQIDGDALSDFTPGVETQLIAREMLTALWGEVRVLPLQQRTALLLNLRDDNGASAIPLLVFTGTATLDEIGAALELDRARMERLWDELPLADLDIAVLLQTTRARVIGLRRAARERLARLVRRRGGWS